MKHRIFPALMLVFGLTFLSIGLNNCAAGKGQYNPTTGFYDTNAMADTIVVTVENTRAVALGVFDSLMRVERENEAALRALDPGIHKFAEKLRHDSEGWLNDLTAAKKQYQVSRSALDATKLKNVLDLVDSALTDAAKYLTQSANALAKKGTP